MVTKHTRHSLKNWTICISILSIYIHDVVVFIADVMMRYWIRDAIKTTSHRNTFFTKSNFWNADRFSTDASKATIGMIHDLRGICLKYVGISMDSVILNEREHHQLHSLLLPHFSTHNRHYSPFKLVQLSLIYRATDQEFDEKTFYASCKGRHNLLVVLENHFKNVVGGFMSNGNGIKNVSKYNLHSILQTSEPIFDSNAFLFRLRSNRDLSPQIFTFKEKNTKYHQHAITTSSSKIFAFGWTDMTLFKSSATTIDRNIGRCFVKPTVYDFDPVEYSGGCDQNLFVANAMTSFYVEKMEIFQIDL